MSLRRVCRELLLEVVLRRALAAEDGGGAGGESTGRLQLVVDEKMLRILNSFLKMGDLHAEGVTSMELIERQREPLPGLSALYLLVPSIANIDLVLADYKSDSAPQHRQAHFAFSQPLTQDLMSRLVEGKCLVPRVRFLVEVPLSFVLIQDRGFHFDMLESLPGFFPTADPALISEVSHKLADMCRCMQVTSPCIRHATAGACKLIAQQVQEELSVSRRSNKDEQVPCQLVIVDRSFDVAATLVHEYTYEAVAYDLLDGGVLDAEKNVVTIPGPPKRELLLSESDPLWEQLKNLHLEGVKPIVDTKLAEVQSQNISGQDASQLNTSDLLDMLRRSPEQRDAVDRIFLHLTLIEQIFVSLEKEHLTSGVGLLEQDIACGVDKSGKDVKAAKLQEGLSRAFDELEGRLSSESKLRLLMLYFACMANVSEVVRQKLIEIARLEPDDQDVLMAMLRTKLTEVPDSQRHKLGSGSVHRVTKEQATRFKRNAQSDGRFELSRFEPRVKELLEQLAQGRLSEEDFPTLEGSDLPGNGLRFAGNFGGSASSAPQPATDDWSFASWTGGGGSAASGARTGGGATTSASGGATANTHSVSQRIVVFIVGGVTHSELRTAAEVLQELPRGTEIILGGTALLTPRKLIQALRPKRSNPFSGGDGGDGVTDALDLT